MELLFGQEWTSRFQNDAGWTFPVRDLRQVNTDHYRQSNIEVNNDGYTFDHNFNTFEDRSRNGPTYCKINGVRFEAFSYGNSVVLKEGNVEKATLSFCKRILHVHFCSFNNVDSEDHHLVAFFFQDEIKYLSVTTGKTYTVGLPNAPISVLPLKSGGLIIEVPSSKSCDANSNNRSLLCQLSHPLEPFSYVGVNETGIRIHLQLDSFNSTSIFMLKLGQRLFSSVGDFILIRQNDSILCYHVDYAYDYETKLLKSKAASSLSRRSLCHNVKKGTTSSKRFERSNILPSGCQFLPSVGTYPVVLELAGTFPCPTGSRGPFRVHLFQDQLGIDLLGIQSGSLVDIYTIHNKQEKIMDFQDIRDSSVVQFGKLLYLILLNVNDEIFLWNGCVISIKCQLDVPKRILWSHEDVLFILIERHGVDSVNECTLQYKASHSASLQVLNALHDVLPLDLTQRLNLESSLSEQLLQFSDEIQNIVTRLIQLYEEWKLFTCLHRERRHLAGVLIVLCAIIGWKRHVRYYSSQHAHALPNVKLPKTKRRFKIEEPPENKSWMCSFDQLNAHNYTEYSVYSRSTHQTRDATNIPLAWSSILINTFRKSKNSCATPEKVFRILAVPVEYLKSLDWGCRFAVDSFVEHFKSNLSCIPVEFAACNQFLRRLQRPELQVPVANSLLNLSRSINLNLQIKSSMDEAIRILAFSPVLISHTFKSSGTDTDEEAAEQQVVLEWYCRRICALPFGQAAIKLGCTSTAFDRPISIPKIQVPVKFYKRSQAIFMLDSSSTAFAPYFEWTSFHVGVSSALQLCENESATFQECESWVWLSRPKVIEPSWGGFLFGLGLLGRLTRVSPLLGIHLLRENHTFLDIGFLLGCCVSSRGSGDPHIWKLIALSYPSMFKQSDPLSTPLNKMASLVGAGILFQGIPNSVSASLLLDQMMLPNAPDSHYICAAIGLGFAEGASQNERVYLKLSKLTCDDTSFSTKSRFSAYLALGAVYFDSADKTLLSLLELPLSASHVCELSPELIFIRILSFNLIDWKSIGNSQAWVEARIPSEIPDHLQLWIIAAHCYVISLRFAGTSSPDAINTCLSYLDVIHDGFNLPGTINCRYSHMLDTNRRKFSTEFTFEGKIYHRNARACMNVVIICCSLIMAGTGDARVFSRIRQMSKRFGPNVCFGSHFSASLSLGLLFLGAGKLTLSTTTIFQVLALIAATLPNYPLHPDVNHQDFLPLRYFWVLAVVQKEMHAIDLRTGKSIPIEISIQYMHQLGSMPIGLPGILPNPQNIKSIFVTSSEVYPMLLDGVDFNQLRSSRMHQAGNSKRLLVQSKSYPCHKVQKYCGLQVYIDIIQNRKHGNLNENLHQLNNFMDSQECHLLPSIVSLVKPALETTLMAKRFEDQKREKDSIGFMKTVLADPSSTADEANTQNELQRCRSDAMDLASKREEILMALMNYEM
jgi:hypothetical protein